MLAAHSLPDHPCLHVNAIVCTNFTMLKNTKSSHDYKCFIKFIFKRKRFSMF